MKIVGLFVLCFLAYLNVTCAKFTFGPTDLATGRALLKKNWRKCSIEKRTKYVGSPIDTIRGVKNSHECCVKCKKNSRCDRWTYLPGKWDKCTLFNKKDRSVKKVNDRYHISGYASWRLQVKSWPKEKKGSQSNNNEGNKNKNKEEIYQPPGFGEEEVYNPPDFLSGGGSDGEEVYNPPGFDGDFLYEPDDWSNCDPFIDGPLCLINEDDGDVKDYKRMNGKTLYGRRLNSILNCVGNRASTTTKCESMCNNESKCTGWTWTELDCSWIGEKDLTGVCYLMGETDENDVYDAPEGRFVSGLVR